VRVRAEADFRRAAPAPTGPAGVRGPHRPPQSQALIKDYADLKSALVHRSESRNEAIVRAVAYDASDMRSHEVAGHE